jgi:hypothetical protein
MCTCKKPRNRRNLLRNSSKTKFNKVEYQRALDQTFYEGCIVSQCTLSLNQILTSCDSLLIIQLGTSC